MGDVIEQLRTNLEAALEMAPPIPDTSELGLRGHIARCLFLLPSLAERLERAERDAARLDWLESIIARKSAAYRRVLIDADTSDKWGIWICESPIGDEPDYNAKTLRAVIDAARKETR